MSHNNNHLSSCPLLSFLVMTADGTHMTLDNIYFVFTPNLSCSNLYYILNITSSLAYMSQLCDSGY